MDNYIPQRAVESFRVLNKQSISTFQLYVSMFILYQILYLENGDCLFNLVSFIYTVRKCIDEGFRRFYRQR